MIEDMEIDQTSTMQMCTFRMANRLFGVNILDVKEVNENTNVTPIYHAPPDVCGYINIRGQILLVVNLRETFGFDQGHKNNAPVGTSKVVVFKSSVDESFGILVDEVCDVIAVEQSRIVDRRASMCNVSQEIKELRRSKDGIVMGVCPLDRELLLVLNARHILAPAEKTVLAV
ncbi:MAG: chemotaxis protein CheW [Fibromonadaceae bacterium]|jgi:purine-binding chemotaxis protein CheW|nr:chemotaxis protein CheW [Fibromonadaceae bacterium]